MNTRRDTSKSKEILQDEVTTKSIVNKSDKDLIGAALAKAQGEMSGVVKDKRNDFTKANYATITAAFAACRQALYDNHLSFTQTLEFEDGIQFLKSTLIHKSGQQITSKFALPKSTDMQKLGGYITYARKYSLMSMLGLCPVDDDDGNQSVVDAAQVERAKKELAQADYEAMKEATKITKEQVAELEALLVDRDDLREKAYGFAQVNDLKDLQSNLFDKVKIAIERNL